MVAFAERAAVAVCQHQTIIGQAQTESNKYPKSPGYFGGEATLRTGPSVFS